MPKRPTLAETVLPGFNSTRWIGLLAPAGTPSTPSEIVQKIATDLRQLMASEDLKPMFVELGVLPGLSTHWPFALTLAQPFHPNPFIPTPLTSGDPHA